MFLGLPLLCKQNRDETTHEMLDLPHEPVYSVHSTIKSLHQISIKSLRVFTNLSSNLLIVIFFYRVVETKESQGKEFFLFLAT